jgi:hypothetical protein
MNSLRSGQVESDPPAWSNPTPEEAQVVSTRAARQGVTGHNVRYVLSFSLLAVVVVFAAIFFVYFK